MEPGVGIRPQSRLGVVGDEVHGHVRRAEGALGGRVGHSRHIRRSRTGPRHDDAAHLRTNQRQEGLGHPKRSPQVGVQSLLGSRTGAEPNTGIVHQTVELLGLELRPDGFGGRSDGGLVGHVNENRLDGVGLAGCPLDVGDGVLALGVGPGPEEDVASFLDELLAQGLANAGIPSGDDDVFAHRGHGLGKIEEEGMKESYKRGDSDGTLIIYLHERFVQPLNLQNPPMLKIVSNRAHNHRPANGRTLIAYCPLSFLLHPQEQLHSLRHTVANPHHIQQWSSRAATRPPTPSTTRPSRPRPST